LKNSTHIPPAPAAPFVKLDDITLRVGSELLFAHTDWEIGRKGSMFIIALDLESMAGFPRRNVFSQAPELNLVPFLKFPLTPIGVFQMRE
jgi:hypothetical protein